MGVRRACILVVALLAAPSVGKAEERPRDLKRPPAPLERKKMDLDGLDRVVRAYTDGAKVRRRGAGVWEFAYAGVPLMMIADASHDRMRIITPIKAADELTAAERDAVLAANFHTALDARYAVGDGLLFGAFIHPLGPLTEAELRSAIRQVANLSKTFGSTYSSGELVFPGASEPKRPPAPANDDGKIEL